jgi:glycosyltransferase involved in cell wall biosynthesis
MQTLLSGLHKHNKDLISEVYRYRDKVSPEPPCETRVHTNQIRDVPNFSWIDSTFNRYQWQRYFPWMLEDCHLMMTQGNLAPVCVQTAQNRGIPSFYFVRSLLITGYGEYDLRKSPVRNFRDAGFGAKVQYPFLLETARAHKRAVRDADTIIANSSFVAETIEERYGVEPEIIYPPIQFEDYYVQEPGNQIVMINPRTTYKGGDIFLDMASEWPQEEFLVVGKMYDEMCRQVAEMNNVDTLGWCDDMREAYRRAKVVVVPSRYEEPFGRVAAEPMVSGIPVVVSNRGGLPEVVGDAGEVVSDIESTARWRESIQRAIEKNNKEQLQAQVEQFKAEKQVDRLLELVEKQV